MQQQGLEGAVGQRQQRIAHIGRFVDDADGQFVAQIVVEGQVVLHRVVDEVVVAHFQVVVH